LKENGFSIADGSDDEIKYNKIGGACSTYGARRGAYRVLVGKPEGKRPLGRCRNRWEVYSIDWINLAKDKDRWGCS
jgi:hypothetical protein